MSRCLTYKLVGHEKFFLLTQNAALLPTLCGHVHPDSTSPSIASVSVPPQRPVASRSPQPDRPHDGGTSVDENLLSYTSGALNFHMREHPAEYDAPHHTTHHVDVSCARGALLSVRTTSRSTKSVD